MQADDLIHFLRGIMVVTEKNIKIYYTKPPIIIFGLLFPLFMFLAFYLGKEVDFQVFFPGLLAMFLFFISSSVGPLITPWEKQAGTFERLLSFPVSINTIILGDSAAGMIFGIMINLVVLAAGLIFLNYNLKILILIAGILLGSLCFSSLGVLLASPSVPNPSYIMMLSSLVRFPLIFVSGIFIPIEDLEGIGLILSYISPITYLVDIFNYSFTSQSHISVTIDFTVLLIFSLIFIYGSNRLHKKNLMKGL
ncbi:ABC-2 type transporter [Candidatus Methanoperedenaceae archaeon GB37]|nr:ABC-2 type transporter [Candidatus Methanoperedenaceae archaeon GB37]